MSVSLTTKRVCDVSRIDEYYLIFVERILCAQDPRIGLDAGGHKAWDILQAEGALQSALRSGTIRRAFFRIIRCPRPSVHFEAMHHWRLLRYILPELDDSYGVEQNRFHKYDIFHHSVYAADAVPRQRLTIRIAALFHDLGKTYTKAVDDNGISFHGHEIVGAEIMYRFAKKIGLPHRKTVKLTKLVRNHMFHYSPQWTDAAVRRLIRRVGKGNIDDLFRLRMADRNANGFRKGAPAALRQIRERMEEIQRQESQFGLSDLCINGNQIMNELDIPSGPEVGRILRRLLERVQRGDTENEYSALKKEAMEYHNALGD